MTRYDFRKEGTMLKLKKGIAAVLAAAFALALSACTLTTPEYVLTVDGEQIPAGVYLMYQLNAYSEAENQLEEDQTVKNGQIDGQDAVDWVHEKTLEDLRRWVWINREFDAQGLTLEGDELKNAQSEAASNYDYYGEWYEDNGIGAESYEKFYMAEVKYQKLYEAWLAEQDEISTADAEAYMDENYTHIVSVALPVSDNDGNRVTDEARETINGYAQELADGLNAGGDFDTLAEEAVKKACETAGRDYEEETTLSSLKMDGFSSEQTQGYFSEDVVAAMESNEVGYAMAQVDLSAPMVYQRVANYADDAEFESTYYDSIVSLMRQQEYQDKATEAGSAYAVEEDASAVKAYAVKNIKEQE